MPDNGSSGHPPLLGVGAMLADARSRRLRERQQAAVALAAERAGITPETASDAVSAYLAHMRESNGNSYD